MNTVTRLVSFIRFLTLVACISLAPTSAFADDVGAPLETREPDVLVNDPHSKRTNLRPWLYGDDATIPAPLRVIVQTRVTYTSSGQGSVTRPFASNLSAPGGLVETGGEVGLLPLLALDASVVMGFGDGLHAGMVSGLRFAPLAKIDSRFHVVFASGYFRDRTEVNGLYIRGAASYDAGRFRFATMVHGEHVFAPNRDDLDILVTAGASVRIVENVRAGIEYVGQDLEEVIDDEAEGGARHFVGPVLSFDMFDHKVMFAGGPAAGLSYGSPRVVGRMSLAYAF